MTNTWHTYQTRLAASLNHWLTPAPRWLLVRGAALAALERPSAGTPSMNGEAAVTALPIAAHVVTCRTGYIHHGIYVGHGRVVHYRGLVHGWRAGPVEEVSLEEFARGRPIAVRPHATAFDRDVVIARARSRIGENAYRILSNNCEHFCEWCLHGRNRSLQVEVWRERPRRAVSALFRLPSRLLRWLQAPQHAEARGNTASVAT
jgi:hypothetical protein